MSDTYTCSVCKGVFAKAWSDEEAVAETRAMYGDEIADSIEETCAVTCDDCHKEFLEWFEKTKASMS